MLIIRVGRYIGIIVIPRYTWYLRRRYFKLF